MPLRRSASPRCKGLMLSMINLDTLDPALKNFRALVRARGQELYRDLPWRNTYDPYEIWISEVMLQQTQVTRVDGRWQSWLKRFPSVFALAHAQAADVLEEWQGLGYNRRALSLHRAAQAVEKNFDGQMPSDTQSLIGLPGIGPATAAGIRAFAFNAHSLYLETNVRAVFLHELFPGVEQVSDGELKPLVDMCCPPDAPAQQACADDPRSWYYALLDYGAYLKKTVPNPSRRSKGHVKQSRFEGSHRQKRAAVLRLLLDARPSILTLAELEGKLNELERAAGRPAVPKDELLAIMAELSSEGFCTQQAGPGELAADSAQAAWSCA